MEIEGFESLAAIIAEEYPLGQALRVEPLPAVHQRRHRKLLVHMDKGRFLAKTYDRDPTVLDALRFQHRLSDHLDAHGLPIAHIQRARSGKRIVERGGWAIELQVFVEGGLMRITRNSLTIAGDALGRFHEVCSGLPRPDRDARMWRFSEVPRQTFATLFEQAKKEGDPEVAIDCCNRIALFLRDASQELSLEKRKAFENGLIHGDWHVGNLIYRDGQLAAIVDLEFAGEGCFLEDLAYGLSNLCVRTSSDAKRLEERITWFLRSYQRQRSLSFFEEAALYYAVGIKHVTTVSYQLPLLGGRLANMGAYDWIRRLAEQCEWLADKGMGIKTGNR